MAKSLRMYCGIGFFLVMTSFLSFQPNKKVVVPTVYIVDRIEENLVVVEWSGGHFKIPKEIFSLPVKEGDVLKIGIDIDTQATKNRRDRIKQLMEFDEY